MVEPYSFNLLSLKLPPELRIHIYRHALTFQEYTLTDRQPQHDAIALLSSCKRIYCEALPIFKAERRLVIDLAANLCCAYGKDCIHITTEAFLGKIKIREAWLDAGFNYVRLITGAATAAGVSTDWKQIAYNFKAIYRPLQWPTRQPAHLSVEISLGSIGGQIKGDELEDLDELAEQLASTGSIRSDIRYIMDSFRKPRGLMTEVQAKSREWFHAPSSMSYPESTDWVFNTKETDAVFKLIVIEWIGNVSRATNKRVYLRGGERRESGCGMMP